jgi:Putative Actinobacterial Holin-X, holin superfamily III
MQTDRSIADLTRDLAADAGDLFRNEMRLARAEAVEAVKGMGEGIVRAALGLVLAGAAVTLALFSLAYVLGEIMPMWAAALIGAVAGGLIAYGLVKSGLKAISVDRIALPRTAEQVSNDLRTLKEKVSS